MRIIQLEWRNDMGNGVFEMTYFHLSFVQRHELVADLRSKKKTANYRHAFAFYKLIRLLTAVKHALWRRQ